MVTKGYKHKNKRHSAQLVEAKEKPKPMQTHQVLDVSIGEDEWEIVD
tara:strand:- start:46 stop:186 length:141 start_codon:yes stop_codon:yes gene_type:complete